MKDKHPTMATTPPPLPTERATPELSMTANDTGGGASPGALAGAGQWSMSAEDRLLPDPLAEPTAGPSRAMRLGVAAAVAVVAGVLLVEMVRRSPEGPAVTSSAQKGPSVVVTAEPVRAVDAASGRAAADTTSDPVAISRAGSERQHVAGAAASEPPAAEAAAPAVPATAAVKREEPAAGASQVQLAIPGSGQAKAPAPVQTGSLPSLASGTPVTPKVLNAPGAAGTATRQVKTAATAVAPDTKTAPAKSVPPARQAQADAPSPAQAELPPVRPVPTARSLPPSDAYSPGAALDDRRSGRQVAAGPVVGEPVRSAPRAAERDDYMAPGASRGTDDYHGRRPAFDDAMEPAQVEPPRRFRTSSRPLAPPHVDSRDPYQVRAMTVGLHPQTPPEVLRRLSNADYRNANIAIQTAVAETPDGRLLVWPREENPGLATYLVRVGPGREPGCRRYVVKIEKDGRTVTAPEMETCAGR